MNIPDSLSFLLADTEIDWVTYCQQARLFLTGERDYAKIQGDTGPLVCVTQCTELHYFRLTGNVKIVILPDTFTFTRS